MPRFASYSFLSLQQWIEIFFEVLFLFLDYILYFQFLTKIFIINISANLKENKSRENTAEVHEKFESINFSFTFSSPSCLHFNISILLSHNGRLLCTKVYVNSQLST